MRGTARLAGLIVGGTLAAAPAIVPAASAGASAAPAAAETAPVDAQAVPAVEAGTLPASPAERVADLNTTLTGGTDDPILQWESWFVELEGAVLFGADDGIHGNEPWISDGTEAGTRLVADVCPGVCPSFLYWPTKVGDSVFFSAEDGEHGRELWVTDGTAEGTRRVADLRPGLARGAPGELAALGDLLLFSADDGTSGRELWTSDGTPAGTLLLADLNPGSGHSLWWFDPLVADHRAAIGSRVFFRARPDFLGAELAVADTADATLEPIEINRQASAFQPIVRGFLWQPRPLGAAGERVIFGAGRSVLDHEPWSSNGTAEGTFRLSDLARGTRARSRTGSPRSVSVRSSPLPSTIPGATAGRWS